MVENTTHRTGIDPTDTDFLTATVEQNGQTKRVLSLSRFSANDLVNTFSTQTGVNLLSIPDNVVISKSIKIESNETDIEKKIQFELKHSLLDEALDFCYDTVATSENTRPVAMLVRKTRLNEIQNSVSSDSGTTLNFEGCTARSIALGRGFLEYCLNDTERLICLADFSTRIVSLCFVLGSSIVAPASFDQSRFDWSSEQGQSRIIAELKTIINFKLNELNQRGIKIGLSKLIFCGGKLTYNQKQAVANKLSAELETPQYKESLFENVTIPPDSSPGDFLVALGLTAE